MNKKLSYFFKMYAVISVISILFTSVILLVTLNRFWQYEAFYYDHGIYDMAIWRVSRFQAPIIEHLDVPGKWIFADHFHPSIFLLTPLYWLTDRQEILLIAQAILIGMSVFFAYLISEKLIKSVYMRFALLTAYVGFIGFQNALIANFHDVTFMVFPLLVTYWAAIKKKWGIYWIFLIITLGSREMASVVIFFLGFSFLFKDKITKKNGIITMIFSLLYGILAIKVIIPYFSGGQYLYQPNYPQNLIEAFKSLFFPWIKLKTILVSFLTFGFLPLLYPPLYLAILQDYVIRFVLNSGSARWDLGLHYNVTLTPLLFIAAVEAVSRLEKFRLSKFFFKFYSVSIIVVVLILHQLLHGPFGLVYNPEFYRHTKRQKFMDDFINKIPLQGKIMVPNNIAVRLTHYDVILPRGNYVDYAPETIVIDLRDGQNANNFWPLSEEIIRDLRTRLTQDKNYKDIYNDPNRSIFVKINNLYD